MAPISPTPSNNASSRGSSVVGPIVVALTALTFLAAATTFFIFFRRIKRNGDEARAECNAQNDGGKAFTLRFHPSGCDGLGWWIYSTEEGGDAPRRTVLTGEGEEQAGKGRESEDDDEETLKGSDAEEGETDREDGD